MNKFDLKYSQLEVIKDDLKYKCRIDVKSFVDGALKRIVGGFMDNHGIEQPDDLIGWVNESQVNKNELLLALTPEKTEFFRDHGLWSYLKNHLPKMVRDKKQLRVLDLGCSTGDNAYSLQILLSILGLEGNVNITVADKYQAVLDKMAKGVFPIKNLEGGDKNFLKIQGITGSLKEKVKRDEETFLVNSIYRDKFEQKLFDLSSDRAFDQFDIVLCRNVMCYISLKKSRPVYKALTDFTKIGGLLVLGVQEDLTQSFYNRDFECVDEEIKVYKKIK